MSTELFDEAFLRKLEYLAVVSRRMFTAGSRGERRSRRVGSGIEFADHRSYCPGDDLRYLDWSAYGRLGRLLVRMFEEEEDLPVYLLLDTSGSMGTGTPAKLTYAARVAAALAYVALASLDRVSLVGLGGNGTSLAPMRGRGQIFKVFDLLAGLRAAGPTNLEASIRAFVHRTPRRGVAVVLSDFYDPRGCEPALDLLRYHRFEPGLIQILDPAEARPTLSGELTLVDVEDGTMRELSATPRELERYHQAHQAYCDELSRLCARHDIPSFQVLTSTPFEELLLRVLRRGGLVT